MTKPLGEVLSASITGFVAELWRSRSGAVAAEDAGKLPRFGSFVRVDCAEQGIAIYACVYNVITGPQDSLHKPAALRMTRQQLRTEQPHIFSLLRTEVQAVSIAYAAGKSFFHHLPPHPAQVHDFVYPATQTEVQAVTARLDFLRLLATVTAVPSEELLAASLRQASLCATDRRDFLVHAGRALTQIYPDYDRLQAVLAKLQSNEAVF